ncbi:MAG: transposase [Nitrospirota bacterium]
MPRGPRLDAPGVLHHVMVRGIEQREIFRSDDDRADFVRRLARLIPATQTTCVAWCFLSNHVHLVLRSGPQGLAHVMRRLLTGYAVVFNRKYGRAGHLFQNRYHSIVCEEEPYLLALVRYVHLNPVQAGIVPDVQTLAEYSWCGHGALMGRFSYPWQATAEVLERFAPTAATARRRYAAFVAAGLDQNAGSGARDDAMSREPNRPTVDANRDDDGIGTGREGVLGGAAFTAALHARLAHHSQRPATSCRAVVLAVCRALDISPEAIVSGRRTRPLSDGRAVIAYVGRTRYRLSGTELAAALGTSPPAVIRAERRGERLLEARADLRRAIGQLVN